MKKIVLLILALILTVGLAVPAAAAGDAKATTMRLAKTEGDVTVLNASGVPQAVIDDMRLSNGYTVTTGSGGYAYITLDDSKAIKLDQDTSVVIRKSLFKLEVHLTTGELFFNVTAPLASSESLQIRTSTMITGIRGSSGYVSAKQVYFITGHGTVTCFDAAGTLEEEFDVQGGEGVVGVQEKKEEAAEGSEGSGAGTSGSSYEKISVVEQDIPSFILEELPDNAELQADIREEGNLNADLMIEIIDEQRQKEEAEYAEKLEQLVPPPSDTQSDTQSDPQTEDDGTPSVQIPLFDEQNAGNSGSTSGSAESDGAVESEESEQPDEPDGPKDDVYLVSFLNEDGERFDQATYAPGEQVTPPDPEQRTGYSYRWVSTDADLDKDGGFIMPDNDVTVSLEWTVNRYTITFDSNGGSAVSPITADYGSAISAPQAPTKTGYTFAGWDSEIPEIMPAEDLTFIAQWSVKQFTVSFVMNGHGTAPAIQTVPYNEYAQRPATPTETGYAFNDWYEDAALTQFFDFESTPITANTVIYAEWEPIRYSITYDSGGAPVEIPGEYGLTYGDPIDKPDNPVWEGHSFEGWDPEIPEIMPARSLTFTAQWSVNTYDVIYVDQDGSPFRTEQVAYGTDMSTLETPATGFTKEYEGTVTDGSDLDHSADYYYTFNGEWDGLPETMTMPARDITVKPLYDRTRIYYVNFNQGTIPPDGYNLSYPPSATPVITGGNDTTLLKFYEGDAKGTNEDAWNAAASLYSGKGNSNPSAMTAYLVGWSQSENPYSINSSNEVGLDGEIWLDNVLNYYEHGSGEEPVNGKWGLVYFLGDGGTSTSPYELYSVWSVLYSVEFVLTAQPGETVSLGELPDDFRRVNAEILANYEADGYVLLDNPDGERTRLDSVTFNYVYGRTTNLPKIQSTTRGEGYWLRTEISWTDDNVYSYIPALSTASWVLKPEFED